MFEVIRTPPPRLNSELAVLGKKLWKIITSVSRKCMAMTPEGKVKAKIKECLNKNGIWFCMPIGTGFGSSGVPDFICCWQGKFLAIEAKAPGRKTTPLQDGQIASIRGADGFALVVDDVSTLERFLMERKKDANTSA